MQHKQKRRAGGKVTPSFIRNIRKGYLQPNGKPLPGCEAQATALLNALNNVKSGLYLRALNQAKRVGINLETMYHDYQLLIREASKGRRDFVEGLEHFCEKHNTPIRVRMAA